MGIETQIVNGTTIITTTNDAVFSILQILIPVIATSLIAIFTIYYSKKSHQRTAMMDVFHMLNKDETKKTEDDIIRLSKTESFENNLQDEIFYNEVRRVWRNYDQIGSLISKNLIPKNEFYLLFGIKMVALYICSHNKIMNNRKTRPRSMAYFSNMVIDCFKFHQKRKFSIDNPITGDSIKREDLGEKIKL